MCSSGGAVCCGPWGPFLPFLHSYRARGWGLLRPEHGYTGASGALRAEGGEVAAGEPWLDLSEKRRHIYNPALATSLCDGHR